MPLNGWIPRRITSVLFFSRLATIFPLIRRAHWNLRFFVPFASPAYPPCLTGREFSQRSQKRYDDTDIIVSELLEWGYDSERGKRALRRLNQLHGRFTIANEDFLYVLSTFIFEPIRWNGRFGWRLLCEQERLGYFYFWREVGRRMNIRDIPVSYDVFERFNKDYEREHYRFTEANRRVGAATRELFASWFPRFLAPVVRSAIYALLDDRLIEAFGFPQPSRLMRRLVPGALRLRAGFVRLLPPPNKPRLRTEMGHPRSVSRVCDRAFGTAVSKSNSFSIFFSVALLGWSFESFAQNQSERQKLLTVWAGMLPIILSAPHGGRQSIPGVPARSGTGVIQFATGRDNNTDELAEKIAIRLEKRLNAKPFLVVARVERKYLDANRPRALTSQERQNRIMMAITTRCRRRATA